MPPRSIVHVAEVDNYWWTMKTNIVHLGHHLKLKKSPGTGVKEVISYFAPVVSQ